MVDGLTFTLECTVRVAW